MSTKNYSLCPLREIGSPIQIIISPLQIIITLVSTLIVTPCLFLHCIEKHVEEARTNVKGVQKVLRSAVYLRYPVAGCCCSSVSDSRLRCKNPLFKFSKEVFLSFTEKCEMNGSCKHSAGELYER